MVVYSKSMPPLKAMKPKQLLYQTVQEEVKMYIIRHGLKPGDPLPPETQLAQQLNISRNSVREAVKALEALGILKTRPGTGLFVRDFSFDPILDNLAYGMMFDLKQLMDIVEVRFHLEYGMVEKVIQQVTPEQIERLRDLLNTMDAKAQQGEYSVETDRIFHQCLYESVNNLILWKILDIFWGVLQRAEQRGKIAMPDNPIQAFMVHVPLLNALEHGDIEEMRSAMINHYVGLRDRVKESREE